MQPQSLISRFGSADARSFGNHRMMTAAMFVARFYKSGKEWMRGQRLGFEFRMELHANKPRVIGHLNHFHIDAVRSFSSNAKACGYQRRFVLAIEFIAMAVSLGNFQLAVGAIGEGARLEFAGPSP